MTAAVVALVIAATTAGCRAGKGRSDEDAAGALPERLGAKPAIVDPGTTDTTVPAGPGSPPGPNGADDTATTQTTAGRGGGGTQTTPPPAVPFRTVVTVPDRSGDAGLEAPPYDDIVSVRVDDNGTSVRFTVEFAAAVPARLPEGEIMGVGVDVFHGEEESAYQVFADGSASDGWLAYLQVGDRFVKYRGTFELAGSRLVFAVPWADVGGRKGGSVSAFADWSKDGLVVASVGADKAPDRSPTPFSV